MGNSPTPRMMSAAFSELGLDATYEAVNIQTGELGNAFGQLRESGFSGLNITMPYKSDVMAYLETLDALADKTGAVNAVKNLGGTCKGFNTDVAGILGSLKAHGAPAISTAAVLGTGGAARAFVGAMSELGCRRVTAVSRRPDSRAKFLSEMKTSFQAMDLGSAALGEDLHERFDLVFNATPCGSKGIPIPQGFRAALEGRPIVFDAVYSPVETDLVRMAVEEGCQVVYGHEMLLHQGVEAFRLWTSGKAPVNAMRKSLLDSLEVPA